MRCIQNQIEKSNKKRTVTDRRVIFLKFLKASIADLITLLFSSVQNSEKLLNLLYEGGEVPAAVVAAHVGHK
jgi:hypothetical protein